MGAVTSLATAGLETALASKRAKTEDQSAQTNRQARTQTLIDNAAEDRRNTDAALKRRQAQERARAGAAGVASSGGSIDAVLQGLQDDANADKAASATKLKNSLASLDADYKQRSDRNLLSYDSSLARAGTSLLSGLGRRSLLD